MRYPRQHIATLLIFLIGAVGGCAHEAGVIFPKDAAAPIWPSPPDQPRIRYVGRLNSSADLKPALSSFKIVGDAVLGADNRAYAFNNPKAICTDEASRIFITDSGDRVVHVLNLNTREYDRWTPRTRPFRSPVGIAYDSAARRLLVADSAAKTIFVFNDSGVCTGEIGSGLLDRPCGLAVDRNNGRIIVVDCGAHQLVVLSPRGDLIQRVGSRGDGLGQFNFPTNIVIDHHGRVYVSDSLNFRVQQFDTNLKPIRQIGRQGDMPGCFAQPKGLAVDSADHLYVIDSQFEAIQIFNDAGDLLLSFGEQGTSRGAFCLPSGLYIDSHSRIWVADTFNRRVQVFDYLREAKP